MERKQTEERINLRYIRLNPNISPFAGIISAAELDWTTHTGKASGDKNPPAIPKKQHALSK
jgi:hypothetical protein